MKSLFLLASVLASQVASSSFKRFPYPNYSFDYDNHVVPIAYTSAENAVELFNKVKLNPRVLMKGGGYHLDVPLDQTVFEEFETNIEFTINSDPATSRHLMVFFSRQEPVAKDFFAYQLGYKTDFEGVGVFLFRHMSQENKWYLMTMQNSGV